jgi:hypothetical protein
MGAAGAASDGTGHRPLGGCEAIRPHQRHLQVRQGQRPDRPNQISWPPNRGPRRSLSDATGRIPGSTGAHRGRPTEAPLRPDASHPVHRQDIAVCELAIGGSSLKHRLCRNEAYAGRQFCGRPCSSPKARTSRLLPLREQEPPFFLARLPPSPLRSSVPARSPRLQVVQTSRATGGEPGARIVYLSGSGDRCPVWAPLSGPGRRVGICQRGHYPVRRGADDSDGGVSPTHRGRAGSARRSRASRTSWSRSGPAGRLR